MMNAVQEAEHDTQLLAGIRIGLQKARNLGYDVERMDVTASIADGLCAVHFAPASRPGFITAGGDLVLKIDSRTDEVVACQRGQ